MYINIYTKINKIYIMSSKHDIIFQILFIDSLRLLWPPWAFVPLGLIPMQGL